MSTQAGKDVIYIDIDDEITTIIDKVRGSEQRIVALVLPKRAAVLQSIVNMKLLKKTADESKKHLVLITNEHGLLPLAGAVGIYVAKTLQTKPEVPNGPAGGHDIDEAEETVNMNDADDVKLDRARPVGEYAGAAAAGAMADDDDQPIELDNADLQNASAAAGATKPAKQKKNKKLMVPDFNKFRMWLVLGATGLVAIIFLFYIALSVMPRASITIKTDSSAIETNMDVTLSTTAKEVDEDAAVVPAEVQQTEKTATQQVDATGQKDKGTKASGKVTLSLKDCSRDEVTIPAGTGVASGGLTFITQKSATLTSVKVGSQCRNSSFPDFSSATVNVLAQSAGDKYNLAAASYTVAGFSNVSGSGTQMTGGTSNIVKVVSQADIDGAKQKISQDAAVKSELVQALEGQGLKALDSTLVAGDPQISTSANVGDEADSVTVTAKTTYSMVGAKESDLKKIIAHEVNKQIDPNKQEILDYGLNEATFKLQNHSDTTTLVTMADTAVAGSDLNLTELKKQIAGKKSADVKSIIGNNPGVTDVTVHYSPFWVSSTPKKTSKITITVEKPAVKNAQ